MKKINSIIVPEFNNFRLKPNNKACKVIDTTRLWVEILWWLNTASDEFKNSDFKWKLLIDWDYSLVIRYKREKENTTRSACTLSFDEDNKWNICINQIQWSKDKHIAFRYHSSFDNLRFYLKLIEESFSKKWVYVYIKEIPKGLESASYASNIHSTYKNLKKWLIYLNTKYNLRKA